MKNFMVRDLDLKERPREKLKLVSAGNLSDAELLAIILRSGGSKESVIDLSRRLLSDFEGMKGLFEASIEQLVAVKNIGFTKAVCLKAVREVGLRLSTEPFDTGQIIKSPKDLYKLVRKDIYGKEKEFLFLISLNTRSGLISKDVISVGTVNLTLVHPREIFRQALQRNAVSVALVHNHPSGDPTPSNEDIVLTEKVASSGRMLGIALIDHVVVCDSSFVSLKALDLFKTYKVKEKGGDKYNAK